MNPFDKALHRPAVLSLYRALFRHACRIRRTELKPVAIPTPPPLPAIHHELTKCTRYPEAYLRQLSFELVHGLQTEFRAQRLPQAFLTAYLFALRLEENLLSFIEDANVNSLITAVVEHRSHQHKVQQWRANLLANRTDIAAAVRKQTDDLTVRRNDAKLKRPVKKVDIFHKLGPKDRHATITAQLSESRLHSDHLLRRFLRWQQYQHKIPNPLRMSSTPEIYRPEETMYLADLLGSTRQVMLEAAYDLEYIEAVVKPGLAFDINKYHYLDHLDTIVNEKGPFRVKVKTTAAGATLMPYIKMPYPRKQLNQVAIDAKKLWTASRIRNVWECAPDTVRDENVLPDGSYSIPGSRGHGPQECMYPRYHYQKYAESEAVWEYLLQDTKRPFLEHLELWVEPLDIASRQIQDNLQNYLDIYQQMRAPDSPVFVEREALQEQLLQHYDDLVTKYNRVLEKLRQDQVHKHSEIINSNRHGVNYRDVLETYSTSKKDFPGLLETERVGLGKTLGDYLDEVGYRSFGWGKPFYNRFKIKQ